MNICDAHGMCHDSSEESWPQTDITQLFELKHSLHSKRFSFLTWFSPHHGACRKRFAAMSSSARRSISPARSHGCAFRVDLAMLFALHKVGDEASIESLTADSTSTGRTRFVLTTYLIFLILHSLVLQPTWPGRDIAPFPRSPCERQCVTWDKLPSASPERKTLKKITEMMMMIEISGPLPTLFRKINFNLTPLTFCIGRGIVWLLVLVP